MEGIFAIGGFIFHEQIRVMKHIEQTTRTPENPEQRL
jgi:hypothetical protein